jgi:hypothetical protein
MKNENNFLPGTPGPKARHPYEPPYEQPYIPVPEPPPYDEFGDEEKPASDRGILIIDEDGNEERP